MGIFIGLDGGHFSLIFPSLKGKITWKWLYFSSLSNSDEECFAIVLPQ